MSTRIRYDAPPSRGFLQELFHQANTKQLSAGVALLVLTAFSSPVFVLNLAPVYGALPPHIFHNYGVGVAAACGYFLSERVSKQFTRRTLCLLPVLAFWLPTIQYIFLQGSSFLGNPAGPLITDFLIFYPLVTLAVICARKLIPTALRLERYGGLVYDHAPLVGFYVVWSMAEGFIKGFLSRFIGYTFFLSRSGLQLFIAALYAAAIPSKWLVLAIPSLLFSLTSNVHLPLGHATSSLNSAIHDEGFVLLARQDSVTGYISVLENLEDNYRVMRCDHSLLGGQWTGPASNYHPTVKDPVYAVFTMLEAVRLVENDQGESRPDANSRALVM